MPEFVAKRPKRYKGVRLRDLCGDMHAFFRDANVSALQKAQFAPEHLPEMVDDAARRRAPAGAQQCRLSADRRDRGPDRDDAVRGLSAGHRDDRAGRAASARGRGR